MVSSGGTKAENDEQRRLSREEADAWAASLLSELFAEVVPTVVQRSRSAVHDSAIGSAHKGSRERDGSVKGREKWRHDRSRSASPSHSHSRSRSRSGGSTPRRRKSRNASRDRSESKNDSDDRYNRRSKRHRRYTKHSPSSSSHRAPVSTKNQRASDATDQRAPVRPKLLSGSSLPHSVPNDAIGVLFVCTDATRKECFERALAAGPSKVKKACEPIQNGRDLVVLYDLRYRRLYGPFRAAHTGSAPPEPTAFQNAVTKSAKVTQDQDNPLPVQLPFSLMWNGVYAISNQDTLRETLPQAPKANGTGGPIYRNDLSNDDVRKIFKAFEKHGTIDTWATDIIPIEASKADAKIASEEQLESGEVGTDATDAPSPNPNSLSNMKAGTTKPHSVWMDSPLSSQHLKR